ncbi:MAG: hypothetical protein CMB80_34550 [Flammeovirgaceae bacterium]|nr:hypothetical protein [Flammeovirgaceae bacterium]MBE62882.1 hypothetical protein [Flammeovirgaceae bacterium]MBR09175.1 hypothetical protein [Rickettsiales bacterium]HCX21626.1 hypothetical protein [Cytophagales bacterium]
MRKMCLWVVMAGSSILGLAQSNESASIGEAIDNLTSKWDSEAKSLRTYDGLIKFCDDQEYRFGLIEMLNEVHHYDSVLYDRLTKAQRYNHSKEIEKTLKDISKFEKDYSMKDLIHFLHSECVEKNKIEKNAAELRNDIGENSYDGQVYLIEVELNKYIKHITKRVDIIRDHVHHLHLE